MFYNIYNIGFNLAKPIIKKLLLKNGYSEDAFNRKCGIFDFNTENFSNKRIIMFHGVSVGEINAIEKLVKQTRIEFPEAKIVVTTGTNTGQENAQKKLAEVADFITYFPFDTPDCVKNFLDKIQPTDILMAETEIWPCWCDECKKRGIKLYIINGRISDRTFNSYKKLKFFFSPLLKKYTGIYTQSTEDLNKFIELGANIESTKRMNNLKFDITAPNIDIDLDYNGKILLAASTHSGEDEIVIENYKKLKEIHKDLKLIIAPRHLTRLDEIKCLLKDSKYSLRSENGNLTDYEILILDTMGELGKIFSFAYISFIGGSFNKTGGHNPLESIILGKPVISGPSINNFKDIYAIIQKAKAGFVVKNAKEFFDITNKMLSDKEFYKTTSSNGIEVFNSQQGALDFVINILKHN